MGSFWQGLLCSYGRASELMGWAGQSQGKLHNGKVHWLAVVASHLVVEPSGAQQWWQAMWKEGVQAH